MLQPTEFIDARDVYIKPLLKPPLVSASLALPSCGEHTLLKKKGCVYRLACTLLVNKVGPSYANRMISHLTIVMIIRTSEDYQDDSDD